MVTYESSGSLTTIEKSYSSPQTPDLSGLVYTLNGETISVDVVGSPGEAGEEIVTQSLAGATSYDLTWSNAHTDFEVVFNLSTVDDSVTPEVDDLTLVGAPNAPVLSVGDVTDTPSVVLEWPAVDTADEYKVYRATSPGTTLGDYTLIDTTATAGYTDTTPVLDTAYYYRVTAVNTSTGESPASNEQRARVSGDFTNSVTWDTQVEWDYGSYTDTTGTGSGGVQLAVDPEDTFNYSISASNNVSASIEIRDADTSAVLFSDSVASGSASGSHTVDTLTHPRLEFYAEVDDNNANNGGSASISEDLSGTTLVSVGPTGASTGTFTDTATQTYGYLSSGTYETDVWDYTNTTTATRLETTATLTEAGQSITITPITEGGQTGPSVSVPDGTSSTLIEIPPSDRYYLDVTLNRGSTGNETPVLESATLESHTPTGDTLTVDAVNGVDVDLSWSGVSVSDGYQILRATDPGTTPGDYTPLATTTNTTYTDSSGDAGVQYHYRVRAQYTGE